jgi:flavin-dependent dehydrogenase
LKEKLEEFKKEQSIKGEVNYIVGGNIPCGVQRPLKYKNILFVGDAGIGTLAFIGQGIYRALISGDVAGRCIAYGYPNKYPRIIYRYFMKYEVLSKPLIFYGIFFNYINCKRILPFIDSFKMLSKISHI